MSSWVPPVILPPGCRKLMAWPFERSRFQRRTPIPINGKPTFFCSRYLSLPWLVPLLKRSGTTVQAALNDRGVDPRAFTANRLDNWLGKIRGLNRMLLMAFRNIFRRRARFLLSVGLLASAGTLFVAGLSTMGSLQAKLDQGQQQTTWDVEVQFDNTRQASATTLKSLVVPIPHVIGVEAWTILQTSIAQPGQISVSRTYPDQGHASMNLSVVPADSSLIPPYIFEGRWLRPGETGAVVIAQKVRAEVLPGVRS